MPASATENPSIFDVSIIYNIDAKKWPEHISKQLSPSLRTRFVLDTDLSTVSPPITDSKVIIVIVTNGHFTLLQSEDFNHYMDIEADSGIIFMCGVDERDLKEHSATSVPSPGGLSGIKRFGHRRTAAEAFPTIDLWKLVQYQVTSEELKKTVDSLMTKWVPSKVKLHPKSAHSEVPTSIVLSFTDEVQLVDDMVDVLLSDRQQDGESVCVKIRAARLNPYTYTFEAPEHRTGSVGVKVLVNDNLVSRSLTITYHPTVSGTVKNVSCIYMHLIDTLCSRMLNGDVTTPSRRSQTTKVDSKADLDLKLSSMFDAEESSVGIPVQAFEQLFGVHKFSQAGEVQDIVLPTLIHLSAKHGLQELCAKLLDLPDAGCAFQIANESGQLPDEIARENNHDELADLLETFKETSDFGMYVARYENDRSPSAAGSSKYYVNVQGTSQVQECIYMAMDKGSSEYVLLPEQTDENVYDDAHVPPTGNIHTYMNSNMSATEKNLKEIVFLVKAGKITQAYAEKKFRDWQSHYEGGRHAKSFKEKQAQLRSMKSFLSETTTKADNATSKSPQATGGRTISLLATGVGSIAKGFTVPPATTSRDSSSSSSSRDSALSTSSSTSRTSRSSVQSMSESEEGSCSSPVTSVPPQVPPRLAPLIKPHGRALKK